MNTPVHSAGIVVVREGTGGKPEFLVLQSRWGRYRWSPPKGGLNCFEAVVKCAFRELWEETSLSEEDLQMVEGFKALVCYDMDKPTKRIPDGKKRVSMFLGILTQPSTEIRLSREHRAFDWISVADLPLLEPHWCKCLQDCSTEIERLRLL